MKYLTYSILITGLLVAGVLAYSYEPEMGDDLIRSPKPEYITAPENNAYKIGVQNYDVALASNINTDKALQYKLDNKFISFKPIEMRWDNTPIKTTQSSDATISEDNYYYKDAMGIGIDIDMNFGERIFEKIVKINSLKDLGTIPQGVEYLEIEFEVETNFIIDGWNKYDDFEITETVRLGDYSYIEPANAWDSYSEEVCEIIEEEEICETLTNRVKIKSFLKNKDGKLILTKQVPVEWLKIAQYPIWTDLDITYGDASTFESTDRSTTNRPVSINTNKFVVVYARDVGINDDDEGHAIVGTVSGTTIEWGSISAKVIDDIYGIYDGCKVGDDRFAISYPDMDLGQDGYTRVATTSGTVIGPWGSSEEFETGNTREVSLAQLDDDKYITCYDDESDSSTGKCVVNTVSGTTITLGSPLAFDGGTTDYRPRYTRTVQDGTDKFVTCFSAADAINLKTYTPHCVAGTVSTRTISFGDVLQVYDYSSGLMGLALLDTDKFVVCYTNEKSSAIGLCKAGTISGTDITYGSSTEIEAGDTNYLNTINVDSTHFVSIYADGGDSSQAKSVYCSVNWATKAISCGSPEIFETGITKEIGVALISTDKIVICFQDDDDSDKGNCIIGDTPSAEPPAAEDEMYPRAGVIIID